MRKELLVYVNTNEVGEEVSISSLASNRKFALVNLGGHRAAIDIQELQDALVAIQAFDEEQKNGSLAIIPEVDSYLNVEYGNEE